MLGLEIGTPFFNQVLKFFLLVRIRIPQYVNRFCVAQPLEIIFCNELQSIARLYTNANAWEKRFIALGGIPRYVLEDVSREPEELLRAACRLCSLEDVIKVISVDAQFFASKTKVVQSLIHLHSKEPFTRAEVRYASRTAVRIIVQTYSGQWYQQMQTLLACAKGNSLGSVIQGYIFEQGAMKKLHEGGTFTCRHHDLKSASGEPVKVAGNGSN